jgi:RNA polymerase subunit RPABC4/transcription elongation factor Spt4
MGVTLTCARCGAAALSSYKFCSACGGPLGVDKVLGETEDARANLPEAERAVNSKLISCSACGHTIALDAATCPSCGAKNTWLHPAVTKFLTMNFDQLPAFRYYHGSTFVRGECETDKSKSVFKLMHVGLVIMLLALVLLFISMTLAMILLVIGTALSVVAQVWDGPSPKYHTYFSADFSSGTLEWKSDDDLHWAPIKKFFIGSFAAPAIVG